MVPAESLEQSQRMGVDPAHSELGEFGVAQHRGRARLHLHLHLCRPLLPIRVLRLVLGEVVGCLESKANYRLFERRNFGAWKRKWKQANCFRPLVALFF